MKKGKRKERETKKQPLNYKEHTDGYQTGGGLGGWGNKGLKSSLMMKKLK